MTTQTATVTLYENNAGRLFLHRQNDALAYDVTGLDLFGADRGAFAGDAAALAAGDTADWVVETVPAEELDQYCAPKADLIDGRVTLVDGGQYAGNAARAYLDI